MCICTCICGKYLPSTAAATAAATDDATDEDDEEEAAEREELDVGGGETGKFSIFACLMCTRRKNE
nr:hypothetical protein [Apis mellifera nudivirus]